MDLEDGIDGSHIIDNILERHPSCSIIKNNIYQLLRSIIFSIESNLKAPKPFKSNNLPTQQIINDNETDLIQQTAGKLEKLLNYKASQFQDDRAYIKIVSDAFVTICEEQAVKTSVESTYIIPNDATQLDKK